MISIIIPAYNEKSAIEAVIKDCRQALAKIGGDGGEIIVIDDGSSDNTAEAAQAAGAAVIRHVHNLGYGRSIKNGIKAARNETIAIIDGDGTYPADKLPLLWDEYQKGFHMVVGQRQGHFYDGPFVKMVFRLILKLLVEFTAGRAIKDINSGLRIFGRKDVIRFFHTLCNTFSFTTSLTLAYMMTGRFVTYIPIPYQKRIGRTKVRFVKDAIRTMQYIVEAILYYNPMKIFIVLSFGLACLSGTFFAGLAWAPGNALLVIGLAFLLSSFVMFGLGLIAMLVQQMLKRNYEPDPPGGSNTPL